jgi:hypothetical protein
VFEAWANANSRALFNILFPGSLSAALLGADTAHLYGQQLLLTTVLGADAVRRSGAAARAGAAGLAELEWFNRDDSPGSSGRALQGLYDFTDTFSVQRVGQIINGLVYPMPSARATPSCSAFRTTSRSDRQ